MEQKCLYLHTAKNLDETEKILRAEDIQIIFKSQNAEMNFFDLTDGEWVSWFDTLRDELSVQISNFKVVRIKVNKQFEIIEKALTKLHSITSDINYQSVHDKFEDVFEEVLSIDKKELFFTPIWRPQVHLGLQFIDSKIPCSCIIAKSGNNVIRYLSFLNDPVLSIRGPNATELQKKLADKFC